MSIGSSTSGISFAGLGSGLDTQSIVAQLMSIERIPVQRMQVQQQNLQNRLDIYGQLQSAIGSFRTAASALSTASAYNPVKSSVLDSTIATVDLGANAIQGSYQLKVHQLATSHKVVSDVQTSTDSALNMAGTVLVNGKSVTIAATDSLSAIASKINGLGSGVTASIIGGSGSSYISLTSNDSGAGNAVALQDVSGTVFSNLGLTSGAASYREAVTGGFRSLGFTSATDKLSNLTGTNQAGSFTINGQQIDVDFTKDSLQTIADNINTKAGSTGITASIVDVTKGSVTYKKLEVKGTISGTPSDPNGVLAGIGVLQAGYKHQAVAAKDASYSIDGIERTSSANAITDAVQGLTINLLKDETSGAATTTISVSNDTDKVKSSFKSYMDAFNGFADFIHANTGFDPKTFASGPLFGDSLATQAMSTVQNALFQRVPGAGTYQTLADIGFGLDSDGKLTLDDAKLTTALSTDPASVKKLMTSAGSSSNPDIKFVSNTPKTNDASGSGFSFNITRAATKASTIGTVAPTLGNIGGEKLTFSGTAFSTPVNLTISAGTTVSQLADQINNNSRLKSNVLASVDSNGMLQIESLRYGSLSDFQVVSDMDAGTDTSGIGKSGATYVKGVDVAGTINKEPAVGTGQFLVGKDTNATSAGLQIQYTGTATGLVGTLAFNRGLGDRMVGAIGTLTDIDNGAVSATNKSVQSQIDDLTTKISEYNDRLTLKQQSLNAKFLAMEQAISQMQQQQARLASLK